MPEPDFLLGLSLPCRRMICVVLQPVRGAFVLWLVYTPEVVVLVIESMMQTTIPQSLKVVRSKSDISPASVSKLQPPMTHCAGSQGMKQ